MIQKHATSIILRLSILFLLVAKSIIATMDHSNTGYNVEDVFGIQPAARIIAKFTDPLMIKRLTAVSNRIDEIYSVFYNLDTDHYTELELFEMTKSTLESKGIVIPCNVDLIIRTEDGKVIRKYINHVLNGHNKLTYKIIDQNRDIANRMFKVQYRLELPLLKPLYLYKEQDHSYGESFYCIPMNHQMQFWSREQKLVQIETEIRRRLGGGYLLACHDNMKSSFLLARKRAISETMLTTTLNSIGEPIEPGKPFNLPNSISNTNKKEFIEDLYQQVCRILIQYQSGLVYQPQLFYRINSLYCNSDTDWCILNYNLFLVEYLACNRDINVQFKFEYPASDNRLLSIPIYLNNVYLMNIPNSICLNDFFYQSYISQKNNNGIILHPRLEPFRGILPYVITEYCLFHYEDQVYHNDSYKHHTILVNIPSVTMEQVNILRAIELSVDLFKEDQSDITVEADKAENINKLKRFLKMQGLDVDYIDNGHIQDIALLKKGYTDNLWLYIKLEIHSKEFLESLDKEIYITEIYITPIHELSQNKSLPTVNKCLIIHSIYTGCTF